jgi:seryl-tRNA synthetase
MLDIKRIRESSEQVKKGLKDRNDKLNLDALLKTDQEYRKVIQALEKLRHEKRTASDQVGKLKQEKKDASKILEKMKEVAKKEANLEAQAGKLGDALKAELLTIPNVPHESVPVGSAKNNREERSWGDKPTFSFKPKDHTKLIEQLQLLDLARAAKISGSHFLLFTGLGARLERGLINFMLDLQTQEHGYQEIAPPYLVNRSSMIGTGQLPKMEEDMYRLAEDDLYLIPTAEVPLTNIYSKEILEGAQLPLTLTAATACFRREAGSYGKETKGMTRVHQFDKVELVRLVEPETSYDELEKLVAHAEAVLQRLEIPYRVLTLATGDLSFSAAKCYDIEAWSPGTESWLEVSSCSNFEDFQARRAQIRYRDQEKKVRLVHTLNGSGVALARTVIALIENHQNEDGSVNVPEALQPYMGGLKKLVPPS